MHMFGAAPGHRLPTILLIDDDMVSREVMATVLTMSGYTVHTAAEGVEAITLLDAGTCIPDVILMDTQMPGLSGPALIQALRARSKAVLYAISGSPAPNDVIEGADGFLLKPIGPEALQRVLITHSIDTSSARPSPIADLAVINQQTLAQFRALMPETAVREIYTAVLQDLDKRQSALSAALICEDSAEIRRIGHAIKGGCGMAGAMQASRLGELFESRGDDLEYSRTLLPELRSATENLRSMLNSVM